VPRIFIILAIALILSGGTWYWFHSLKSAPTAVRPAAAPSAPPVPRVLVAAVDLPTGTLLSTESLKWQAWTPGVPTDPYLAEGKVKSQDYVGAVTRLHLTPGQPILPDAVVLPGDKSFMAAVLAPGMRAITINVGPTTSVAGFARPGDRVDLLLTTSIDRLDQDGQILRYYPTLKATETILTNLRLLGADQTISDPRPPAPGGTAPPHTVTLEVTPKQAEIISVASDRGGLSLVLHSLAGSNTDIVRHVTRTYEDEAIPGLGIIGPHSLRPLPIMTLVRGSDATELAMAPYGATGVRRQQNQNPTNVTVTVNGDSGGSGSGASSSGGIVH